MGALKGLFSGYDGLTRWHLTVAVRLLGVNPNGVRDGVTGWCAVASREALMLALEGVERDGEGS